MEITPEIGSPRSGTLMLHLLGQCNLTCRHCYMDGSPVRREQLPLERVMEAVGSAAALDIGTLYLTEASRCSTPDCTRCWRRPRAYPVSR